MLGEFEKSPDHNLLPEVKFSVALLLQTPSDLCTSEGNTTTHQTHVFIFSCILTSSFSCHLPPMCVYFPSVHPPDIHTDNWCHSVILSYFLQRDASQCQLNTHTTLSLQSDRAPQIKPKCQKCHSDYYQLGLVWVSPRLHISKIYIFFHFLLCIS